MSKFKYLWYVLDESGTEVAQFHRKVMNEREFPGVIRSLINDRVLLLEAGRVLHKGLLGPVLFHCSETNDRTERDRSGIWAVQMGNLRGLLSIRRMDRVPNARIS